LKRANTMEKTAAAGKKIVERKKKGEPTHKMGRRSAGPVENDRDLKKIVEAAGHDGKKRRLTALERTALEGASYVSHKKAKTH